MNPPRPEMGCCAGDEKNINIFRHGNDRNVTIFLYCAL